MNEWTPSARRALDAWLERQRPRFTAEGVDADEITADLRAHVEAELAGKNLAVVTEDDVRRAVAVLGEPELPEPPPAEAATPPAEPAPQQRGWRELVGRVQWRLHWLFGVILPAGTLGFELFTTFCASEFMDPLASWFHVVLVALVPLINAWTLVTLRRDRAPSDWLWRANGVAVGIAGFYAVLFLPMTPFAAAATIVIIGLLPLAPLCSLISALRLRKLLRLRCAAEAGSARPNWWPGFAFALGLLVALELPEAATRHWLAQAAGPEAPAADAAVLKLRRFGSREVLLDACYGRRDRVWAELLGRPRTGRVNEDAARKVFFRVTGLPFNAVPPPMQRLRGQVRDFYDGFAWDEGHGGAAVAGRLKGLSLVSSRLDAVADAEALWGYTEWTLEFRNDQPSLPREARAQIALPPGGVVSRLTLWVDGEEREAAFAGRAQVREAYREVAVVQRRDPVLVTTAGPDRVLLQCFPVPPKGGTMKVRLGITAPLVLTNETAAALPWPHFTERNFGVAPTLEHALWLESAQDIRAGTAELKSEVTKEGRRSLHGRLRDAELSTTAGTAWFRRSAESTKAWTRDKHDSTGAGAVIRQNVQSAVVATPRRIALVVDGSADMTAAIQETAAALDALGGKSELQVWLAQDGARRITEAAGATPTEAAARLRAHSGVGGQDNVPALLAAWAWATAEPSGAVVWVHGPQPVELTDVAALQQALDRHDPTDGTRLYDVAVRAGPNRIAEKLERVAALTTWPRLGSLTEDLKRLGARLAIPTTLVVTRERIPGAAQPTTNLDRETAGHLGRLWAFDEIQRLIRARRVADAVKLAGTWQLVTPVSGAVVLENQRQYDQAGLKPADPTTVPAVPEPGTWALFALGMAVLLLARGPAFRACLKTVARQ